MSYDKPIYIQIYHKHVNFNTFFHSFFTIVSICHRIFVFVYTLMQCLCWQMFYRRRSRRQTSYKNARSRNASRIENFYHVFFSEKFLFSIYMLIIHPSIRRVWQIIVIVMLLFLAILHF